MLASLDLQNFRAFQSERLDLRPITVFLGPNNSGKSSIIAAVRLLVQTLHSLDYQVPLLLNGALGDFGTYKDVVFRNDRRHRLHIGVGFREPSPQRRRTGRVRQSPAPPSRPFRDLDPEVAHLGLKYRYRTRRRELILDEASMWRGDHNLLTLTYSDDARRHLLTQLAGHEISSSVRSRFNGHVDLHHFLPRVYPYVLREDEGLATATPDEFGVALEQAYGASLYLWRLLETMVEYVGPMRLPPQRTYQHTGESHSRVGGRGENWAAILARETVNPETPDLLEILIPWLTRAGLASDIEVVWLSDRQYELRVAHAVTRESQNIADVGQGNSQVLPVLVGGLHLPPASVFLVEEPEIHLHPHAQAELGDFFVNLYERRVQSLIETHSEYVVLRLQQHVAAGRIPTDHLRFYFVCADGEKKSIRSLELTEDATFTTDLPSGFFPERLVEPRRLARIRGERKLQRSET